MTPDLAFQTAVRAALVPALAGLVEPSSIRTGTTRPESFPAVLMSISGIEITGRAAGGQIVAQLDAMLHVWSCDDDAETAQAIGATILRAVLDAPRASEIAFDAWHRPSLAWVADPAREALHGAVSLSAVVRWRE
ncbi:tail completion protein gp17 [Paracoccus salipaludis]|uniref:DUF3168 domain-containing protein n=1 Tax=Paracoccus salipaludis TaxID=2032623 RepID=A0A2A2GPE9_9RHOB|nr:DUF3168 domain-containing protein [Paracoccus salipaludis]PAU98964.1 hypothetical protein CK240_02220 [Paracoccus salipaludis]